MSHAETGSALEKLRAKLKELSHLKSALSLLGWDQETHMPPKASGHRADTQAYLAGDLHKKFLAPELKSLLLECKAQMDAGALDPQVATVVREVWREFEREEKLPDAFVQELEHATAIAQHIWAEARRKSDFAIFEPHLAKVIDLKRKEARFVGFTDTPYDALLDTYEPNTKTREISATLAELKEFLVPLLEKIKGSRVKPNPKIFAGDFDIAKQKKLVADITAGMGFDLDAGRIDESAHPFTTDSHPHDVRITTRFDPHDLFFALGSTIHESGHALYAQGLPAEDFGTPLGESISLGIHESQSRVWENLVGKGRPFWTYWYPKLQGEFPKPFAEIGFEDFYRTLNHVTPSFIRTESDEVTYNLHIILRFELEKALIEGTIEAKDLPHLWNEKMKESFGLTVPNDKTGVLQDVHWSAGLIGYFPTYSLGNLYSAQFYAAARRNIPTLEEKIARGELHQFREWLKENIHIHGKQYSAGELVKKVSGEPLSSRYFTDYLTKKYSEIYQL